MAYVFNNMVKASSKLPVHRVLKEKILWQFLYQI